MNQELRELGLSEYEIKVYIALLRYGSLGTKPLSKYSGVPQGKIYQILYKLADKKFVSVMDFRPKKFNAVKPEIAIKSLIVLKKEELARLEKTVPEKLKELKKAKIKEKTEEMITVYRGKKNTHPIVMHKFLTAKKYIKDMFTFEYLPSSVLREIKKCRERGVKIYMLATQKPKGSEVLVKKVKKLGVEVRYFQINEIRLAIKDGEESYQMIVNPKDLLDRVSLVVESLELTKSIEHYFDYIWKKAEKM